MIVFCDGMQRSASTWAFNVCVKLLAAGPPLARIYSVFHENAGELLSSLPLEYDHLVVKCHHLDATAKTLIRTGAAKAVYTHREALDAIASYMLMFHRPFDEALGAIRDSLLLWRFQRDYPNCYTAGYAAIREAPRERTAEIARFLGLDLSADALGRVEAQTSFGAMKRVSDELGTQDPSQLIRVGGLAHDPQTLLHRHHLRDGGSGYGREVLSAEQQRLAADVLAGLDPSAGPGTV